MSTAISTRMPAVEVSYNTAKGRVSKFFEDAVEAKKLWVRKHNEGKEPAIVGEGKLRKQPKPKPAGPARHGASPGGYGCRHPGQSRGSAQAGCRGTGWITLQAQTVSQGEQLT